MRRIEMKIKTKTIFEIEFENNEEASNFINNFNDSFPHYSTKSIRGKNINIVCQTKESDKIWDFIENFTNDCILFTK